MKYVIILGDGMADLPCPELNGKTPLQAANCPVFDQIAQKGRVGLAKNVPEAYLPGSDVANLSVMGYDPSRYYTGRSPLEAVSMGIDMQENDMAFRCNLVTLSAPIGSPDCRMEDYSAGEISSADAKVLIEAIQEKLGEKHKNFYPGVSYRHLLVWKNAPSQVEFTPPHDFSKQLVTEQNLPQGDDAEIFLQMLKQSWEILHQHPINQKRMAQGLNPANSLWFWGAGQKPFLPDFQQEYGLQGGIISAVDLLKGIGICAGMQVLEVPGITGNIHTNFAGKAQAAIAALQAGLDLVYLHVEAPDEAGHQGNLDLKIQAIEAIDQQIAAPILEYLESQGDYRLLVLPDHPTPVSLLTHTRDPIPFALCGRNIQPDLAQQYDESTAAASGLFLEEGFRLMGKFVQS
ncbi:MAG: cofactor-independent phosphoglycerate mutase [Clostridia bacterium]|nr:cofactor-independent phosphoglycerate mutase [Clostridia bacterium]